MGRMVIIKKSFTNPKSIYAILLLGIFTFLFLGAEYLYVNMISAYGRGRKNGDCAKLRVRNKRCRFLLYPLFHRFLKRRVQIVGLFILALAAAVAIFWFKNMFLIRPLCSPEWHCSCFWGYWEARPTTCFSNWRGSHPSGAYGWCLLCPWDLPAVSK